MSTTSKPDVTVSAESLGRIAEGVEAQTGHGGAVEAHPNPAPVPAVPAQGPVTGSAEPVAPVVVQPPAPPAVNVTVNTPKE